MKHLANAKLFIEKNKAQLGLILVGLSIIGILTLAAISFRVGYLIKSPYEKLVATLNEDIKNLAASKKLPPAWNDIKEIKFKGDNTWPVQDWLTKLSPPKTSPAPKKIPTKPAIVAKANGRFRLDIFLIHWIEGYRYGAVVQFQLIDLATTNTVWELDRTYKLGFIY